MPYGGTTPEQDKKIERCVNNLMAKGRSKSSAIAICKSSVLKGEIMPKLKTNKEDLIIQSTMTIQESSIDEEKRTVEACVLSPCVSGNKRYYSPAIVEKASGQLIGLKSYADHDSRSIKNTIAKITSARMENGSAIATFKFSKAKDIAESIFTRIKEGIITDVSIAASGASKRVKMNGEWIDEIIDIKLKSVDFVSEGGVPEAKVLQVFEHNNIPKTEEVEHTMDLKELRETYPELVSEIEKPNEDMRKKVADLEKENQAFRQSIKEKELGELKTKLIAELQEPDAIKKLVAEKITGETEADLKKSMDDALKYIKEVKEAAAQVTGIPEVEVKKNKKTYKNQDEIWSDPDLTLDEKGELVKKLWWG